jgi:glyoxylase-like metal-dependent hydrolase (beta-lactamase superfamily II)
MDVKISFLSAGYCTHPERIVNSSGAWKPTVFPASVAVIEHPREGVILFDTGYSERFFSATKTFPSAMYRWLTPVFLDEGQTAKDQLLRAGIAPTQVRQIILSHFHADHIGGVSDFPRAKFVYQMSAYDEVRDLAGFSALRKAFLPSLLPDDFLDRSRPVAEDRFLPPPKELSQFTHVYDLYQDGTIWLVQMPGHSEGHLGLFVRAGAKDYLLTGDACYVRENFLEDLPSSAITRLIFSDFAEYKQTLHRIHDFHKAQEAVEVVPCHCSKTLERLPKLEGPQKAQSNREDSNEAPDAASYA